MYITFKDFKNLIISIPRKLNGNIVKARTIENKMNWDKISLVDYYQQKVRG